MQTNQTIELTTLSQLLHNEEFNRKVIPFLKSEYFNEKSEKVLFEEINDFVDKYKNPPTKTSLEIEIGSTIVSNGEFPTSLVSEQLNIKNSNVMDNNFFMVQILLEYCSFLLFVEVLR